MLTPAQETKIADEEIDLMLEEEAGIIAEMVADGGFMGDIMLPGPKRLDAYWATVTLPDGTISSAALALISEDEGKVGEAKVRANDPMGALLPPYWKNLLREPGLFTECAKDFVALNAADVKRREGGQP